MKEWLFSLGFSWGLRWGVSFLAARAREDKAVLAALKKYRESGTFLQIVDAYASATPEAMDDQIVRGLEYLERDLTVKPFNQVVKANQILALLGSMKIPANDRTVSGLLEEILDKTLA